MVGVMSQYVTFVCVNCQVGLIESILQRAHGILHWYSRRGTLFESGYCVNPPACGAVCLDVVLGPREN